MNDSPLLPDDPKLTAYALGELEPAERAAINAALRDNPAARAAVEEIRALGAQLTAALATEPPLVATSTPAIARPKPERGSFGNLIRFPQLYYVLGGAAAACFALMVALRTPKPEPISYAQIDLASLPTAASLAADQPAVAEKTQDLEASAPAPATPPSVAIAPAASALFAGQNLSLLDQAKSAEALKKIPGASGTDPQFWFQKSAAKDVQIVESGGMNLRNSLASAVNAPSVAPQESAQPRVQRASATQTYPADEKILVEARTKAAVAQAPAANSQFEQAAKQKAFNSGVYLPLAATPPVTLGGTRGDIVSSGFGGVAVNGNSYSGAMFSENRGFAVRAAGTKDLSLLESQWAVRPPASADRYADFRDNDFLGAKDNPLSTFSIDVDTASYSNVRRFLAAHQRPPRDAVRIEEFLNYFPYRYAPPAAKRGEGTAPPFATSLEVAEAPWAPNHRLVRIGLKGREVSAATRPVANLVFLLDVSGSMAAANRLPLAKEAMRLLVGKLRPDDRVAIVTYAGQSGLALPSTPVARAREILDVLDGLSAGGSTNGGMGIQLAYDIAKANFAPGGINRVILCTDGDFNVGVTGDGELTRLIEDKAKSGVALTALGFGMGNYKDAMIEKLADHGNGNYGYIDTRREAEKLLVEQVNGTLLTIAKDVKIQVEFNPALVASYRLIGYENRLLKKEDFNNDAVDAGEIGAGHTVTALYEIVPVGAEDKPTASAPPVDELKYRVAETGNRSEKKFVPAATGLANPVSTELLTVKLRYKEPAADTSQRLEFPLTDGGAKFAGASADFKFAAAVAEFGMILRDSPHKGSGTLADVVTWAEAGSTDDPGGYRAEFVELAREAEKIER
jgi:Ca-activated chloride channel family protein